MQDRWDSPELKKEAEEESSEVDNFPTPHHVVDITENPKCGYA